MKVPYGLISVFIDSTENIGGNTAAVVMLDETISLDKMQSIAADFNQPATSFIVRTADGPKIFWFAPDGRIGLCGHGSLAAFALLEGSGPSKLDYESGMVTGGRLDSSSAYIEFASIHAHSVKPIPEGVEKALGIPIDSYYPTDNKHILLAKSEKDVAEMTVDFAALSRNPTFGWIVTAPSADVDFVSRTLVPHVQQLEDPATGSSHVCLTPFWSKRLGKSELQARQLSQRGGAFDCEYDQTNDTVRLAGKYNLWAKGTLDI